MKLALAALTATALATPASAGVFVNVESNSSRTGSDFEASVTDLHVGYEGGTETFQYYIQGGPAIVAADGVDSDNRLSGKVGGNFNATENLGVYGEVSVLTADSDTTNNNSWGTKIGAKYSF